MANTDKLIYLPQFKRYNEKLRRWINNEFITGKTLQRVFNDLFPVGYVWISYTNTSPASLIGGTWTPITGRFPYFNAGTDTGGANSQVLSIAQMPAHSHKLNLKYGNDWGEDRWNWSVSSSAQYTTDAETASVGGSSALNNMPAYQTLYAWRRTE